WSCRWIHIRNDDRPAKMADPGADRRADSRPLGANRETVGGVLDVAPQEDGAVVSLQRGPDPELGVWCIRASLSGARSGNQRISHAKPRTETRCRPRAPALERTQQRF